MIDPRLTAIPLIPCLAETGTKNTLAQFHRNKHLTQVIEATNGLHPDFASGSFCPGPLPGPF